ncbi:uncharacterized protein LOC130712479 [Lotus japonicus]|uniref:uncharacterized protein LOC130712479 n=1 Tax=Lotus japonicus TaxID=34305 RepID=UPI002590155A|nr:uncharacterized protein LOC130712479 [Lotus japonicus]
MVERIRQNNYGAQQNIAAIVEQLLNQHGFNVGFANIPHFVSAFPSLVLEVELPRGWKVPKFTKFSGNSGESTVEHVARYQIEVGDLSNNEDLKMKYISSSLTKNAFTWFTTLQPNSVHTWAQLERVFHEQFFRGECKVSLKELASVKREVAESIDDYLNRFRQLTSRCFTQVPEHELVMMPAGGLEYPTRKKIYTQHVRDMAQLADRVREVERLKTEKAQYNKLPKKGKVAYVENEPCSRKLRVTYESDDNEGNEIHLAELEPGPPYVCKALKPYEGKASEEPPKTSTIATKTYTFDITKCDGIYDILVSDGLCICGKTFMSFHLIIN